MSTVAAPPPPVVQEPVEQEPELLVPAPPPRVPDEGTPSRADSLAFLLWVFFASLMAFLLLKDLVRSLLGLL